MAGLRAPRAPRRAGEREPKFARAAVAAPLRSGPRAAPASMAAPGPSSGAATAVRPRRSDGAGADAATRCCALVRLFVFEIQLLPPRREASSSSPAGPLPLLPRSPPPPAPVRCARRSTPRACRGPTPNPGPPGGARQHRREESSAELAERALCAAVGGRPPARPPGGAGARLDGAAWRPSPGPGGARTRGPTRPRESVCARALPALRPLRVPQCLRGTDVQTPGGASGLSGGERLDFGSREVSEGSWHTAVTFWALLPGKGGLRPATAEPAKTVPVLGVGVGGDTAQGQ